MAGKSGLQKLIEQYEAEIAEHHATIAAKRNFVEAMRATMKAKAKLKPSRKVEASPRAANE